MVLFEARTQSDLIVLDDEDGGDALHGREVGAFVRRGGLGRSMPAKLAPANTGAVDTGAVPAAMTRALDSYRKMMQERNREAVPVPGLDFQS